MSVVMVRQSLLALILFAGLLGCGGRSPAGNGADDGGIADGPYLVDDAGQLVLDDAGNPIPVQQDAAANRDGAGQNDDADQNDDSGQVTPPDVPYAQDDSGSTPGVIQCGQTTCDPTTQQCCISGGQGGGNATCIDIGGQCQGVAVSCDGPEDCGGTTPICCWNLGGGGGSRDVTCADTCQGLRLCRLDSDCDSGDRCCGSGRVGGIDATWCVPQAQCTSTTPTTGVPCGSASCDPTSDEVCCVTMGAESCVSADNCDNGLTLACDGAEDCSGDTPVCCADVSMQGGGSECVADGDCQGGRMGAGVVCHNDGECQSGETCNAIPMIAIRVCR